MCSSVVYVESCVNFLLSSICPMVKEMQKEKRREEKAKKVKQKKMKMNKEGEGAWIR